MLLTIVGVDGPRAIEEPVYRLPAMGLLTALALRIARKATKSLDFETSTR